MQIVSYPVQRAAEAVFTEKGQAQAKELIDYYLANAAIIRKEMTHSSECHRACEWWRLPDYFVAGLY